MNRWTIRKNKRFFNPDRLLNQLKSQKKKEELIKTIKEGGASNIVENKNEEYEKISFENSCKVDEEILSEEVSENKKLEINVEEPVQYAPLRNCTEVVEDIIKGKDAMKYVISNYEMWKGRLSHADQALSDLLHYIEFNDDISEHDSKELCRLVNLYSKQRREYKDLIEVFNEFMGAQGRIENLYTNIKQLKTKHEKYIKSRSYKPRVLTSLFESNEKSE